MLPPCQVDTINCRLSKVPCDDIAAMHCVHNACVFVKEKTKALV